ncbi:MAG: 50S ribosomal protein L25 [Spirochaetaceae bacterium]|jgi:large subunit ribosomal protein L25|nr:50S ribosomal protein L25 [Spirochaetaceae bacterium]
MSDLVFAAKKRAEHGSAASRRLRRAGRLPGVIYGHSGESISLDLDAGEFSSGIKGITESTIVKVNIDGDTKEAFVKATQRNILDGKIYHVDFYEVKADEELRARVALHIVGSAIGVRDGGVLETPLRDIEVECLPRYLPERINVDVANLGTNQSIHVRDLALDEHIKLISNPDQVIALVKFMKEEVAAAPTEEAEGAAAPAEGEAAASAEGAEK